MITCKDDDFSDLDSFGSSDWTRILSEYLEFTFKSTVYNITWKILDSVYRPDTWGWLLTSVSNICMFNIKVITVVVKVGIHAIKIIVGLKEMRIWCGKTFLDIMQS